MCEMAIIEQRKFSCYVIRLSSRVQLQVTNMRSYQIRNMHACISPSRNARDREEDLREKTD